MINKVKLIPDIPQKSVLPMLRGLSDQSICTKASIAYWTIPEEIVGAGFTASISNKNFLHAGNGFLCVDISHPTNIDSLAEIVKNHGNVFLYIYKSSGQAEDSHTKNMPSHLLHSKLILFKLKNGENVIWIGSHNATNRALQGLNIETSILLYVSADDPLSLSVEKFLDQVATQCTRMDLDNIDYYKWLQGQSDEVNVVFLEDPEGLIATDQDVALFLFNQEDTNGMKNVGKDIFLSIGNEAGSRRFYKAEVSQSANLANSSQIDTWADIYAEKHSKSAPSLCLAKEQPITPPPRAIYFVLFKVLEQLDSSAFIVKNPEKKWIDSDNWQPSQKISYKKQAKVIIKEPLQASKFASLKKQAEEEVLSELVARFLLITP